MMSFRGQKDIMFTVPRMMRGTVNMSDHLIKNHICQMAVPDVSDSAKKGMRKL